MPDRDANMAGMVFPEEISRQFEDKNKKLGEGGFAKVILAEHIPTGEKVAIKIMNKDQLKRMGDLHRAYREISAMKKLSHQHICQLYQVVETNDDIFMVLEYAPGGELFDYIVASERLSEQESRRFFRQIIAAVACLHDKGLAHRDLKPENMLLDETNNIKLIDFGLASDPDVGLMMPLATCCGSPAYAAPELISGNQYLGNAADIWSLGVVLYGLLCGFLPFDVDNEEETHLLYQHIKSGIYDVPEWLNAGSIRLLERLLEVDPGKRITIRELINHEWMMDGYGSKVQYLSTIKKEKPEVSIIEELADNYKLPKSEMERKVKEFKFDSLTAHYFLLHKLRRKIPRPKISFKPEEEICGGVKREHSQARNDKDSEEDSFAPWSLPPPRRQRAKTYNGDDSDLQDEQPSIASPAFNESMEKSSSVFDNICIGATCTPSRPNFSTTGTKPRHPLLLATPRFARKLKDKVVNIITPRKTAGIDGPRKVKAIYKVNTTSTKTVAEVQFELERVLNNMKSKGKLNSIEAESYLFRCRGIDDKGHKLAFELEICSIPCLDNIIGVRHKRLKGDVWSYKRMCDTILHVAKI